MYKDGKVVGFGTLCGNLYRLDLFSNGLNYSVNSVVTPIVASKCLRVNDDSSMLWHKRLGHISRHRMERLVKDGILPNLNFFDLSTCVECVKMKLTSKVQKDKTARCGDVLELIHIDICGPFTLTALGGYMHFITFTDDFSRYEHVELIREKSDSLVAFKELKVKMELQKNKKLKAVRSYRGGEIYGRYDEARRNPRPFTIYLRECGTNAQYTMPSTSQ